MPSSASEWFVVRDGTGNGSSAAPFGRIQDALSVARPGDAVVVGPGTFTERLSSVRAGTALSPLTIRSANGRGTTVITAPGRVLTVAHAYLTFTGLVLDGQYGQDDLVRVGSAATGFTLRDTEVRRSGQDAVDMGAVHDALIEGSLIHHALNPTSGRTDAHGIVGGAVRHLIIRNTDIHTFSGDAIQVDPARALPGWTDVLIEGCRLWLEPLPAPANGFAAGVVPGENAVDTKANSDLSRATLTIRNTQAWGFRNGFISNMAAFNIKENVDVVVDGATVYNSEIAFRLRAPALVRVQNAVVHTVGNAVRYEDNIAGVRIWNSTFGSGITRLFYAASSSGSLLDVRNMLVLGTALPKEAIGPSNLAAPVSAFVNASAQNYQLAPSSPAIDTGISISDVKADRQGTRRPQGARYDVGAYERAGTSDVVLWGWKAPIVVGNWQILTDPAAAGGARIASINEGAAKVTAASAKPSDFFELTFAAEAGRPYRLWIRGKAANNYRANDSIFAQFNDSLDSTGTAAFRIGTSSATIVNLEDCQGCGLSGWGWQDNGYGVGVLGPAIQFARTGIHTIRIQTREDGFSIDQVVLSPSAYLTNAPGALKNDTTILPGLGA